MGAITSAVGGFSSRLLNASRCNDSRLRRRVLLFSFGSAFALPHDQTNVRDWSIARSRHVRRMNSCIESE